MQFLYRRAVPAFRLDSIVNLEFLGPACAGIPCRLAVPPLAEVLLVRRLASLSTFARYTPRIRMIQQAVLQECYSGARIWTDFYKLVKVSFAWKAPGLHGVRTFTN